MRHLAGLLAFAMVGCGGGDSKNMGDAPGASETRLKSSFDLSGVIAFAIGTTGNLLAVHADGSMSAASFTDAPADAVEEATKIFDTPKYVVVTFGVSDALVGGSTCQFVVIRKSDAALTCATTGHGSPNRVAGNGDTLVAASLPTKSTGISRVDMTTTPPTVTPISTVELIPTDTFSTFDVDDANSVLVSGHVYKSDGSRVDLTNPNSGVEFYQWYDTGHDGFYYGMGGLVNAKQPAHITIYSLDTAYAPQVAGDVFSGGNFAFASASAMQAYGSTNVPSPAIIELLPSTAAGMCWHPSSAPSGTCTNDADCDGVCMAGAGGCSSGACCVGGSHDGESCNAANNDCVGTCDWSGPVHPVSGISSIGDIYGGGTRIYVEGIDDLGGLPLIMFDIGTWEEVGLVSQGVYTNTAYSVARNGDLTLAAIRRSDYANVIMTCNSTCSVLSDTVPDRVTALKRID